MNASAVSLRSIAAAAKARTPRPLLTLANTGARAYGKATSAYRPVPDFLIIGTKRGGTTSLWNYLIEHPGVLPMFPQLQGKKSCSYFFEDYDRGPEWYRSHFPTERTRRRAARKLGYEPVTGEASPYYMYDPWGPAKISALMPDVKSIVLLRDPVKRAYSHYWERVGQGVESLSFAEALSAEEARLRGEHERMAADPSYYSRAHDFATYRDRGVYLPQLQRWFDHFARESTLILASEDLYRDEQGTLNAVCDFLNLPHVDLPAFPQHNEQRPPPMPADLKAELTQFYQPHNEALQDYLGRRFEWAGAG